MSKKQWLMAGAMLGITALGIACSRFTPGPGSAGPDPDSSLAEGGQQAAPGTASLEISPLKRPAIGSWQWQLAGSPLDQSTEADLYDIDLFDTDSATVAKLQAGGAQAICYISTGSREDWRPDADEFPELVLGRDYQGWPGERWLDIRRIDLLGPIMLARLDQCQAKGFDGVEPDNIDGYSNDTGFPLTYQDQLAYNKWLADQAHQRGLSIGLKNDPEQAADLVDYFDWALTEDCFAEGWCGELEPFTAAGKPVYAAEYTDQLTVDEFSTKICPQAEVLGFNLILKHRDLGAWRQVCP